VSSHVRRLHSVDAVAALVVDDARPMRRGADFLAHALIDSLIDYVLPTIDRMEEVAEDVQEQAVSEPAPHIPEAILKLKRSTLRIHRVMAPQRELMNRLARGDLP
jgi:magnesium transporter